ncbi:MAG: DNA sulfur modification protein DndD [Burkholderiales bacterium]|nr:DNA sulfur modification protein DndD [Burkholderiales bacterium]
MLLEKLSVCDFGVFRGQQIIDLVPRKKYGSTRPVILFGGLNGAGKTTILTAVRMALYGRQALGFGATQRAYESLIEDQIHKAKGQLVPINSANVSLEFTYSQLGRVSRYKVTREWTRAAKGISENLRIECDGAYLEGLTSEQAQAFLNQLVPVGVSELFFFDGEKISRLASDDGEATLSSSIRRLLGLEVVDKLRADLVVYLRQARTKTVSDADAIALNSLDEQFRALKAEIGRLENLLQEDIYPAIDSKVKTVDYLQALFDQSGGAWASSRKDLEHRVDVLAADRRRVNEEIIKELSGLYPFVLGGRVVESLKKKLRDVSGKQSGENRQKLIGLITTELKKELDIKIFAKVEKVIKRFSARGVGRAKGVLPFESYSSQMLLRVSRFLEVDASLSRSRVGDLRKKLLEISEEFSQIGVNLASAPPEEALADDLRKLQSASEDLGRLKAKKQEVLEDLRSKIWSAIDVNRKLKALEEKISKSAHTNMGLERANSSIAMLDEFGEVLTRKKVESLRRHFVEVFRRLSRKDDLVVDASIDDRTFEVILLGKAGERIPKKILSAGEKQVYAIAMLEALAKTSGRNLPIIVDTPLGRLDSVHRTKLVQHYFPHASHQVIILSTDTEVDEEFYRDLSPSISHAFHLEFDGGERMTTVREGYFWKSLEGGLKRVS